MQVRSYILDIRHVNILISKRRKILKLRETAKSFHRVEVKNGKNTSFWYDNWSSVGVLSSLLGNRGHIDLGIGNSATVEDAMINRRSRRHRVDILNQIEAEIQEKKTGRKQEEMDVHLWRWSNGFKRKFSTRETWFSLRDTKPECGWAKSVWFSEATPKFSFVTWLAMHNRLSTGERMLSWNPNINPSCILCNGHTETRDHIFFSCNYSGLIWGKLTKGIMEDLYTSNWNTIIDLMASDHFDGLSLLALRYTFQIVIHSIWRERNNRHHGEDPLPAERLAKLIDKNIRNKWVLLEKLVNKKYEQLLVFWFSTRD